MSERGSRKIPVTDRQFLWVQDDDKGEVILHVGPTMVSPTAADRVVIDDGQGGFREDPASRCQRMIELSDAQYAVLHNPIGDKTEDEGPNGRFRPGRNESRPLRNGTRHMIPGPCAFYLRPGQRVEVRDAHELASNQYLVVKVYGEVDASAPYYAITAHSATITTATSEDVTGGPASGTSISGQEPIQLTRGQLIVIRGLDTQFYIPPTGVDVVPDLSTGEGRRITAAAANKILKTLPVSGAAPMAEFEAQPEVQKAEDYDRFAEAEELDGEFADDDDRRDRRAKSKQPMPTPRPAVEQAARLRHQVQRPAVMDFKREARDELAAGDVQMLLGSDVHRQALEREVRKARLVRQAVVLGEKEFCVILDADGKRQIKEGAARVFPGPYDSFMTEGSEDRVYYAYELLPQRALWLRFINDIDRKKLAQKMPRGIEIEDKEMLFPGDEMLVTGINSFFFPFNEIEILHPLTGQRHVGNDHTDVFIEAIGIDQKSGIYVRDLSTGEARLVRGKQSYLVDPRKEVHITRTIPTTDWNLWIAEHEPHKRTHSPVTTPWALSASVPFNMAVLATSADDQRVIEGPCVELLEYEETLVPMRLSTGTPKSDANPLQTCYLRTVGNNVSDIIAVETADFVKIDVRVSYRVTFDPAHKDSWFNHPDYVGLLCDRLRSMVRGHCRQVALADFWPNIPQTIRDLILGVKTADGRAGRLFEENGMRVTEVDVLEGRIRDKDIAALLEGVQRESVSLQISDRQASEQLRSQKLRHEIDKARLELRTEAQKRQAEHDRLSKDIVQAERMREIRDKEAANLSQSEFETQRARFLLEAKIEQERIASLSSVERLERDTAARVQASRSIHTEEAEFEKAMRALEIELIDAQSKATVAERKAVQPALVEALTAVGDKMLLAEVASNMNLVSLFKGEDIGTIFQEIVGGTKLARTVAEMLPKAGGDEQSG